MNTELIAYIQDALKEKTSLYQIRTDLLAAGWAVDLVDSHIRFVRENPAATPAAAATAAPGGPSAASSAASPAIAGRRGPGCIALVIIGLVLLFGSFLRRGLLADAFLFFFSVLFWCWIIFWGGDARLECSIFMGLLSF